MSKIKEFLSSQNIEVNDFKYYYEAFTHRSFSNEKRGQNDYQKLEFLGDAILDFIVSEYLLLNKEKYSEGDMSIIRASVVNGETLAKFARELGMHECIRYGNSKQAIKENSKIYADVFEAFIAALYLDKGIEDVKKFLKPTIFKMIDKSESSNAKNPKTLLQEYLQLESRGNIEYKVINNNNIFKVEVFHEGTKYGEGVGKTKKHAEVEAAKKALELLGKR